MENKDEEYHGGMEADMAEPLMVGQHPQYFADSTNNDYRSNRNELRQRRRVAGRNTVKITGMSTSSGITEINEEHGGVEADDMVTGMRTPSQMTESDEEHGGMEADDMAAPLLQGQHPEPVADRTPPSPAPSVPPSPPPCHQCDRTNEDRLRRRRTVGGRKMADITVRFIDGKSFQLEVDLSSDKIQDVMASIKEEWGIPFDDQHITFQGHERQSHCILADCGIEKNSTVFVVLRLRGGGGDPEKIKERWCTYSHKALLISIALFSAYLNNNSTSTSPNIVRDVFFMIFVVLLVIADGALAVAGGLPQLHTNMKTVLSGKYCYGDALVWISFFLLELATCILSISFNPYYAFLFPALLALVVPFAIKFHADSNDSDTEDKDYDLLFKLSEGITSCGSLFAVVLGHYDTVVGPGKVLAGVLFFSTIALGLYLMMVITARAASCRHATWLACVLVLLLLITLIVASVDFIRSPLRSHPQVLQTQQQHAWPPSANTFSRSNLSN